MELHPSFQYLSGSFLHSSGQFLRSSRSPSDAPPELSASGVLWTLLGPYWTLSEIRGTVLRWGAQHTSWGQSPSESVILTPPRDCMHRRATVFNRNPSSRHWVLKPEFQISSSSWFWVPKPKCLILSPESHMLNIEFQILSPEAQVPGIESQIPCLAIEFQKSSPKTQVPGIESRIPCLAIEF
jgi:hypothetical protein